ncbi:MAG TPA: hypothetical protein VI029_18455, partial [Mycobacterium sp.]
CASRLWPVHAYFPLPTPCDDRPVVGGPARTGRSPSGGGLRRYARGLTGSMRDIEAIDGELRLLASPWRVAHQMLAAHPALR